MEKETETRDEVFLKLLSGREEMQDRHAMELEMARMESDANIALAVLRAKLEVAMADPTCWDINGWKDSIFQLTGVHPDQIVEGETFGKDYGATSKEV